MGLDIEKEILFEKGPIAIFSRDRIISIVVDYLNKKSINTSSNEISELFAEVHKEFNSEMLRYIKILPHVEKFLEKLKANNIKIGIVTSDTKNNTNKILDYLNISKLVDVVVGKECTVEDKSTGIPVYKALSQIESYSSNTICIGDTETDIIMADMSKCKAGIAVATGQITLESLKSISKYAISNMDEICVL